jgi:hypothetical protein
MQKTSFMRALPCAGTSTVPVKPWRSTSSGGETVRSTSPVPRPLDACVNVNRIARALLFENEKVFGPAAGSAGVSEKTVTSAQVAPRAV